MSFQAAVLADTPAVFLRLNDVSGTTASDISGNARHGTYTGTPALNQGTLLLEGSGSSVAFVPNQYVSIADAAWMESVNWTAEFRIRFTGVTCFGINRWGTGSSNRAWLVQINADGSVHTQINNSAGAIAPTASGLLTSGQNHTVAVRAVGTALTVFVDGVIRSTATLAAATITTASSPLQIARAESASYSTIRASEMAFWASGLSDARIAAHHSATFVAKNFTQPNPPQVTERAFSGVTVDPIEDYGIGANTTVDGLTGTAAAEVHNWTVTLVNPTDGNSVPTTTPQVTTRQTAWNANPADVQVQVSTVSNFASTVHNTTVSQSHNVNTSRSVTGLTNGVTYYWRARAGDNIGANQVGPWSSTQTFNVLVDSGKSFMQQTINVGATLEDPGRGFLQQTVNIGVDTTLEDHLGQFIYENVGVEVTEGRYWGQYVYEGDVDTSTPIPRIWFLKPTSGRAGDGLQIYGFGFGDLQATFSGVVELDYGSPTGWVSVSVNSWQTFPANNAAYTEDRRITDVPEIRDAIYFNDEFDADGALGPQWITTTASWVVNSGEVNAINGAGRRLALFDGLSDGTVQVTLGSTDALIAFRATDSDNMLYFNPATRQVRQIVANVDTQVGATLSGTAGVINDVYSILLAGTSITVRKNGTSLGAVTSSTFQTIDRHGLLASTASGAPSTAKFRDFMWDSGIDIEALVDMQHTVIGITVPGNAIPPGYPVRVRTNGP